MYIAKEEYLRSSMNALFKQALRILQSGAAVDAEIKKHHENRTSAQNAYYWLFNRAVADFLDKSGLCYGEFQIPYTKDIIHDINKTLYGLKTTTRLSIGDFCDYMGKLLAFWQQRTNGEFQMPELPESYLERHGYFIKEAA